MEHEGSGLFQIFCCCCCSLLELFYGIKRTDTMGGMSCLRRDDCTIRQKFFNRYSLMPVRVLGQEEKEHFSQFDGHIQTISLIKFECLGSRLLHSTGNILSHLWGKVYATFMYNFWEKYPDLLVY